VGINTLFNFCSFDNGGLVFSTFFLAFVAAVSLYSFLLLIETRNKVPASFGDIGGVLFGRSMRMLVLVSITTSQVRKSE
jgi:proton-coupled amino acid transporter